MDPILCSEEIIHLSKAESAALKRASAGTGDGVLMFMANAALQKIGVPGGAGNTPAVLGTKAASPALEEGGCMEGEIVLKIADCHGNGVGDVKIDEIDAELLQKAVTASGLSLKGLLSFIIHRQLEAFFPSGAEGVYSVSDHVVKDISDWLSEGERNSDGLWALCCELVEQVHAIDRKRRPECKGG